MQQKNLTDVKILNRANVFRLICEKPGLTRQEISSSLGLSKMSVVNIITEYVEKGFVRESIAPAKNGLHKDVGRPSLQAFIVPNASFILGIYISEMQISCSIINLECKPICTHSTIPTKQESNDELLEKIEHLVALVLKDCSSFADRLIGIGISSIGLIDSVNGRIIGMDNFPNIHNMSISLRFRSKYNLPVCISNDMDASAVAERHYGCAINSKNFVFMGVNSCIGLGIYINDAIYHGHNGFCGELGYTTIDHHANFSDFRHDGNLETFVRIDRYVGKVNRDIALGVPEAVAFHTSPVTWPDIAHAAQNGNEYCLSVLWQIGEYLAIAVSNVLNLFDPEKIVLGGQIALAGNLLIEHIIKCAEERVVSTHFFQKIYPAQHFQIPLELSHFSDKSAIMGAGAIFLDAIFHGEFSLL